MRATVYSTTSVLHPNVYISLQSNFATSLFSTVTLVIYQLLIFEQRCKHQVFLVLLRRRNALNSICVPPGFRVGRSIMNNYMKTKFQTLNMKYLKIVI